MKDFFEEVQSILDNEDALKKYDVDVVVENNTYTMFFIDGLNKHRIKLGTATMEDIGNHEFPLSINTGSEEDRLDAVGKSGLVIMFIWEPSEAVKWAAVKQNGYAIQHIKNPSIDLELAAVRQNPNSFVYCNSSEALELAMKLSGH